MPDVKNGLSRGQLGHQGVDHAVAAALDDRPTVGMAEGDEQQGVGTSERLVKREQGVRRRPGQEPSRLFGLEQPGQPGRGEQARESQAGRGQGMGRRVTERPKDGREGFVDVRHQGAEQPGVSLGVGPEAAGRVLDGAKDRTRPPTVERVGKSDLGGEHFYASGGQVDTSEERRGQHQRVDGRADVVAETGQGQLGGAGTRRPPRALPRRPPPGGPHEPGSARPPARWGPSRPRRRQQRPRVAP